MKKTIQLFVLLLLAGVSHFPLLSQGIDKPQYQIVTHRGGSYLGTFNIELFPLIAPLATNNFDSLVTAQAFDSTAFHRVVPGFVIQGGDPNSINGPISTWGQGNASQPTVPAEFSVVRHLRGRLGAARDTNINSATSQFYICVASALFLDGQYTVYGQVTSGMDVVDTIVSSPRDANDVPLQKIEMFITYTGVNDSVPAAPVLITPADMATNILGNQSFTWLTVNEAVMYTVEFASDALFTNILVTKNSGLGSLAFPALVPGLTYYWRVKSNNGGHESVPSNVYSFTVAGAASLVSPVDSSVNVFLNPLFTWTTGAGITSYTLQVATNINFIGSSIKFSQAGIIDTSLQVWGLDPNTQYYWRVRSFAGTAPTFYSAKYSFMTGTTIGINEAVQPKESKLIAAVFPNPAKNNLNVEVRLRKKGAITYELRNVHGAVVYSHIKNVTGTNDTHIINVSNFKKGMYVLYVSHEGEEEAKKIEIK